MSATAPSPPPAVSDTKPGLPPGVSGGPALSAGVSAEPQAPLGPGVQQKEQDTVNAKRCEKCKSTSERNLVVCIDGTSNQFSTKNTNVVELYSRLVKDKTQLTFYNSGIGTYAKPSWKSWDYRKQVIANTLDLAFALRFEKIIISAYAWLVDNYEEGDRIFLFGFSRGAYQVRALAAMIHVVGLLHKGNDDQIPFAYELYAASGDTNEAQMAEAPGETAKDVRPLPERISHKWRSARGKSDRPSFPWPARARTQPRDPESEDEPQPRTHQPGSEYGITMQDQFKNTFSRKNVGVHFVGAWDTVSSVGFIRDKTLPFTTNGMEFVCFFRHALALHEFRVKFLPEYVNGGAGPSKNSAYTKSGEAHTKEVWFTGSHSDIGGGSTANTKLNKFGPALRWMSWEASLAGLKFSDSPYSWEPIGVSKSMTTIWSIVECPPIKRLTYHTNIPIEGPSFTWRPHFFARRHILPHQRIHQSVYEECDHFDAPEDVEDEPDAYLVMRPHDEVVRTGRILSHQSRKSLQQLSSSETGIRSLRSLKITQYIYDIARLCCDQPAIRVQVFKDLQELDAAFVRGSFRVYQANDLQTLFAAYVRGSLGVDRGHFMQEIPAATVRESFGVYQGQDVTEITSSTIFPFQMCGHTRRVSSVTFLSNTRMVSGSYDNTLRMWDVGTGETALGSPLSGHNGNINCVAVHAAKGLVASASDDWTIRLWMSDRNGDIHTRKVLQDGSRSQVVAVAFSPDGSHLVSGSADGAICVWNAATGERVGEPARGHTDQVRSVAFSSDGERIVSGSGDSTVRLWEWSPDKATLQPCGGPLSGRTGTVFSVAFSPDARFIASGSQDQTVHIWRVNYRALRFTLEGHTGAVFSVAFAPSGMHVVSGSEDWSVHIWDTLTGAAVRVLSGHTDSVNSVAFSPDGTRLASGSDDNTVRVWDFAAEKDAQADNQARTATHSIRKGLGSPHRDIRPRAQSFGGRAQAPIPHMTGCGSPQGHIRRRAQSTVST